MPRDFIVRADDPSGKNVSTKKVNDAGTDYYIQDVILNDENGQRAAITTSTPGGSAAGLVVRTPELPLPAGAASELTLDRVADAIEGTLDVAVQGTVPVSSSQLPGALGGSGGVLVEVVAGGGGGGGTEYTEGAVDATITGAAILWEDTGDTLRPVSAAKPLPVAVQGTVPVSGTVTITDGSGPVTVDGTVAVGASALPSGAATETSLAAAAASLASIDGGIPAALGAGGGMKVDGSGTPLPISGTVTITDGSGPVTVDGTVAVSSSALPSGAATETSLAAAAASLASIDGGIPAALGAGGGMKVDGSGTALPVSLSGTLAVAQSDTVVIGGTSYTVKRQHVNLTASGDLIAAVSGKKIRVLGGKLINSGSADGTVQVKTNGSGGTNLGGADLYRIGSGFMGPLTAAGFYENANNNESIYATLASITSLTGFLWYVEI